jgi:hypothetical protein
MSGEVVAADDAAGAGARMPGAVALAVVGAAIEAAGLGAAALVWVVTLVTRGSTVLGAALALVVAVVGLAAVLATGAAALRRGSRRARGPVITWQLLQGATGVAVIQVPGRPGWLATGAVAAVVLACAVAGALVTPKAVAFATP